MKIIEKDILTVEKGIICQCLNAQGKMASGVALAIRNKYPIVYEKYIQLCKRYGDYRVDLLGECLNVDITNQLTIANIIGQLTYGYDGQRYVDYCALNEGFRKVGKFQVITELSVYLPYGIGAVRGGGDINIINQIINHHIREPIFCKFP